MYFIAFLAFNLRWWFPLSMFRFVPSPELASGFIAVLSEGDAQEAHCSCCWEEVAAHLSHPLLRWKAASCFLKFSVSVLFRLCCLLEYSLSSGFLKAFHVFPEHDHVGEPLLLDCYPDCFHQIPDSVLWIWIWDTFSFTLRALYWSVREP